MAFVVAVVTALVAISAAPPRPGTSPSSNPTSTPATSPLTVGGRGAMPPRPIHGAAYQSTNELDGQPVGCIDIQTGSTFDYRAQHLFSSGAVDLAWRADSSHLCVGSAGGLRGRAVPDGSGGTFIAWVDSRSSEPDIYLQHLSAIGDTVSGWPVGGIAVCMARYSQYNLEVCADGAGGILMTWQDFRSGSGSVIYAQRITGSSSPAAGWPGEGLALGSAEQEQFSPRIASDGSGGALVFWQQRTGAGPALYAQHVASDGSIASGWAAAGLELIAGANRVLGVNASGDASGRVSVLVRSEPDSSGAKLWVAQIGPLSVPDASWAASAVTLASGAAEIAEPSILRAADGGELIAWGERRSGSSALQVLRLTATGAIAEGWAQGGRTVAGSGVGISAPALLADGGGGAFIAWEDRSSGSGHIAAQRVRGDGSLDSLWGQGVIVCSSRGEQYAPALAADGNGGAIATWVDDATQGAGGFLNATGIPLDDLPAFVRAETNSGYARVVWQAGAIPGATYHVYRVAESGDLTLIASPAPDDSSHLVLEDREAPGGTDAEYRLSLDLGGAERFLAPVRLAIPGDPTVLALERAWPAPGQNAVQIRFSLPHGAPARAEVYDVMGRRLGSLSLAQFTPGYHTARITFNSPTASGVYFVRLAQGSRSSTRRVVFVR